jgi:hypothetical protein
MVERVLAVPVAVPLDGLASTYVELARDVVRLVAGE